MNPTLLLVMAAISAVTATASPPAATRIALVGVGSGVAGAIDTATGLLSKDAELQMLDRVEVGRALREQDISLAGPVRAEHAVKAGQLLHADLFAVLEGALTNETSASPAFGLVVFDARNGVRYADSALVASNALSAASATASAIRAAVAKARQDPRTLHTVGLLRVRNADLPRQMDSLCDSVGLLLERELTASPGIAVLERRRLEQVNRERALPGARQEPSLLSSLQVIELDISRDGDGLGGTLVLVGGGGPRAEKITASVHTRNPASLARLLAERTEQFLKVPADGVTRDRKAEAARYHRECRMLVQHADKIGAVHALDAAVALDPEEELWQREMVELLPGAALQALDGGSQLSVQGRPARASSGALAQCLALGLRGADLLVDLSRAAVDQAKRNDAIPPLLWWNHSYREPLCELFHRLAELTLPDPAIDDGIAALVARERTARMEVMEPYLYQRKVDANSFANYSRELWYWFQSDYAFPRQTRLAEQKRRDDAVALTHWVEVSHKVNPPDGPGNYQLLHPSLSHSRWNQLDDLLRALEQDQDPVIRIYARANRVAALVKTDHSWSNTLAAVREFRLHAQDILAKSNAPKPSPFRDHVWEAVRATLELLLNREQGWQESVEAARFALSQEEVKPGLFNFVFVVLEDRRWPKPAEELEVVNGALRLMLERPTAYPASGFFMKPAEYTRILEEKRDRLSAELAGKQVSTNVPQPALWGRSVCLLDLAKPINNMAWLFKPVVQGGHVLAVGLGFREWGLAEDTLQLVRVPLGGGPPSFLGRATMTGIDWPNRPGVLALGPEARLSHPLARLDNIVRAACTGGGFYFAATTSGVFIFPTNGGPGLRLGLTNGLPTEDIHGMAFLDGKLFFGAGAESEGYLAAYDPATRKVRILASSRRSQHLSPFDDQPPFCVQACVADTARHRLIMSVSSGFIPTTTLPEVSPTMGIWSYSPARGEYKQLASFRQVTMTMMMPFQYWAGLANATVLATKETFTLNLFDFAHDRLLSVYDPDATKRGGTNSPWQLPDPKQGCPWGFIPLDGPFLLHDGWFYSARPFQRMRLADGRTEKLPPLRTDYPFELRESLQILEGGRHILAADQYSLWLLELGQEAADASNAHRNTAALGER
jgi:hypothetical protein